MSRRSSRKADRVIRRSLADGTVKEYRYGPYRRKRAAKVSDTIGDLIAAWQRSPEWGSLAASTQAGYTTYIRPLLGIERAAVTRVTRREMTEHRNAIARARGPGAATGFVRAASAMFRWAIDNGWLEHSPMTSVRRLKGGELPAWSQGEADLAIATLAEPLRRAVVLALYTGQRRSDLIALTWSAYDGSTIRLRQQKTRAALVITVHPVLKAELDAWRKGAVSTLVLTNTKGLPWRGSNLSKQIGVALAGIDGFPSGRNIHGLRKLAAANLADAGCTLHEIAAITGHQSLGMLRLYTASADQERLARSAIVRLSDAQDKNAKPRKKPA